MTATEHRAYVNALSCAIKCLDRAETILTDTHERSDQTRGAARELDEIGQRIEGLQQMDFLEAGQ